MANKRTDIEWESLFDEWERSTETQGAFCRRSGINLAGFKNRRHVLKMNRQQFAAPKQMLPVQIAVTPTPALAESAPELFLQLPNGACLRFVTGTSVAYVSSLVEAIVVRHAC